MLSIMAILIILGITTLIFEYKYHVLFKELSVLTTKDEEYKNDIEEYEKKVADLNLQVEGKEFDILKDREGTVTIETLKNVDLRGINKIMISTHPDDEMFWGGGHLIEDDYLVVCVTCGMDANRQEEFEKSMKDTNDKYLMLSYPKVVDPSLGREFDWRASSYLTRDIENILSLKNWDMIVTHNPDGEYGHKYHILTSQIVTSLVKDKSKLFYFGKYYKASETSKLSTNTLNPATYQIKTQIIDANYKSQWLSADNHEHMFNNENFVQYANWK